jgi:flagellar basal body-associated protein FliL
VSQLPFHPRNSTGQADNKLVLIIAIVNTVALLAGVGVLAYTRLIFKRPAITEPAERQRLANLHASPRPEGKPGLLAFEPMTVNIASSPVNPKPAPGTSEQIEGKLHYANIGFSLELRDESRKDEIEALRPVIVDRFLSLVGRKSFHELTTVQGRYILREQVLAMVNGLHARPPEAPGSKEAKGSKDAKDARDPKEAKGAGHEHGAEERASVPSAERLVTSVYFTHFTVQ